MQKIKNIIFDLGGVILDIDLSKTEYAFKQLGVENFKEYYTLKHASPIFKNLETGAITPETFYEQFRNLVDLPLTNEQIKTAWNSLLLNFDEQRINWLRAIRKKYKIYLLSNTNKIHYDAFTKLFREQINKTYLEIEFSKAYYSFKIGVRKPDKKSYEAILIKENLIAEETLFIDDSLLNIEGAIQAGLSTYCLKAPETILELDL